MRKQNFIYCLLFVCLFFSQGFSYAGIVDTITAKQVGLNFWFAYCSESGNLKRSDINVTKTTVIKNNTDPLYYAFDIAPEGFVIVSADDAVIPVLGYSNEGKFYIDDQFDVFNEWMDNYSKQIISARQSKTGADANATFLWKHYYKNYYRPFLTKNGSKGVTALVTTKWNQGLSYNDKCPAHPSGPGGKCYAGCVATAMAQIMKYWNYPATGVGSHQYYHPYFGNISVDFSAQTYDWTSMSNVITSNSLDAISTLIYHCGVAVEMNYSPLASSSFSYLATDAFRNYFHYRLTTQYIERSNYDSTSWESVIMGNLDDGMPVLYSGSGSSGGHAFVCDGYADTAYFHMNWGWGGSNNGYFALNNLNSGNGDFTTEQDAVINIIPYDAPYCKSLKEIKADSGSVEDGSGYSMYWNDTECTWLIKPVSGNKITMQFTQFDTEDGKDILYVYNGASASAPLLGSFSGNNLPPVLTTTSGKAFLKFVTDNANYYQGWKLNYYPVGTGIGESTPADAGFNIYPNPVNDIMNVNFDEPVTENYIINVYDPVGKLVNTSVIPGGESSVTINTGSLANGIYLVTVNSADNTFLGKRIIVK